MYEIALTVCLLGEPGKCHEVHLTYVDEGQSATPFGCMMGAQPHIAEWLMQHPGHVPGRWTCGRPKSLAKV